MRNYSKFKLSKDIILFIVLLIGYSTLSIHNSNLKSIWRDEAFSSLLAQQSIIGIIKSTSSDYNPPLFYLLLHYWQMIFGLSSVLQRILPLIFSLSTIVVIYKTIPTLVKRKHLSLLRIVLGISLLTNGSIFYYSYELRQYSLMMFLAYLVFYFCLKYYQNQNGKIGIYIILSTVALLYTQTLGVLWFILIGLLFNLSLLNQKKWYHLGQFMKLEIISGLCYLPWAYIVLTQFQHFASSYWLEFNPEEKLQNLAALFAMNEGPLHFIGQYKKLYLVAYQMLGIVFLVNLVKSGIGRLISLLMLLTLIFIYYVSYITPLFYGRYLAFLSPFAAIILALSIYNLFTLETKIKSIKVISILLGIWIVGIYGYGMRYLWNDYLLGVSKVDYQQLSQIEADKYYVTSDLDIMPCMFYKSNCFYVGGKQKIKSYIGLLQLQLQPILNSWQEVTGSKIGVIYRDEEYQEANATLALKGYQIIKTQDIGDGTHVVILEK